MIPDHIQEDIIEDYDNVVWAIYASEHDALLRGIYVDADVLYLDEDIDSVLDHDNKRHATVITHGRRMLRIYFQHYGPDLPDSLEWKRYMVEYFNMYPAHGLYAVPLIGYDSFKSSDVEPDVTHIPDPHQYAVKLDDLYYHCYYQEVWYK